VFLDDSGLLTDLDGHLESRALQRMARKEGQLVMTAVLMLNWLVLVSKMIPMLLKGVPKRKVFRGISISVKRLELLHHQGYLKM